MSSLALVPITNRNCILQDRQKEKKNPDLFREIFCRCSFQTPLFPEKTAIISRTVAFDPAASIAAEKVVPLLIFLSALELGRVKIVKPYHEVFFLPEEFLAYETPTTVAFEEALELSEEHRSDVATLKRLLLPKSHFINREMNRIKTRFEQITSYHYLILQLLDNPSSEKLETLYKQIVRGYLPEDASLVRSVDRFYEAYQEMEIGFSHEEFFRPILMLLREYKYPKRSLADLKNAFIQLQAYLQSFLGREFIRASNIFLKYALGNSRLAEEGAKAAFPFLRDLLFVEGEYVPSELFLTRCSQIIQQAEDFSELDSDSSSLDSIDAGDAKDCNEMRTFIQYFMKEVLQVALNNLKAPHTLSCDQTFGRLLRMTNLMIDTAETTFVLELLDETRTALLRGGFKNSDVALQDFCNLYVTFLSAYDDLDVAIRALPFFVLAVPRNYSLFDILLARLQVIADETELISILAEAILLATRTPPTSSVLANAAILVVTALEIHAIPAFIEQLLTQGASFELYSAMLDALEPGP